jgi:predicted kinase
VIVVAVGISGSGKTTVGHEFEKMGFKVICPDDIRAKIGKDISDQSVNQQVFTIVPEMIRRYLNNGDVYYSATNTKESDWNAVRKWAEGHQIVWLVFDVSKEICLKRVQDDLKNGVNRSNTTKILEDGRTVVERLCGQFENTKKQMQIGGHTLDQWKSITDDIDFKNGERLVFYHGQSVDSLLNDTGDPKVPSI